MKRFIILVIFLIFPISAYAQFFVDNFTEPTSTTTSLNNHTPDTGTGWTEFLQIDDTLKETPGTSDLDIVAIDDNLSIIDKAIVAFKGTFSEGSGYTADVTYPTANYEITVTAEETETGDDYCGIVARVQDEDNFYYLRFTSAASTLYKVVADSETQLDTGAGIADGSVIDFIINGTSISIEDDDVEILSATDSAISAAGKGGLLIGEAFEGGTGDMGDCRFDNFSITDLGGGAVTPSLSVSFI